MTKRGRWFRKMYRLNRRVFGYDHAERVKWRIKHLAMTREIRSKRWEGRFLK